MRRSLLVACVGVLVAGVVVSLAAGGSGSASAGRWVVRDLGTLGGTTSYAVAINERGQVVGSSSTKGLYHDHAFLWEKGKMRDIGVLPGDSESHAVAINESGQIVGDSDPGSLELPRAFLWENGRMRGIGVLPGDSQSHAVAINYRGQVIGSSWKTRQPWQRPSAHAFVWQNGSRRALGALPGDMFSEPVSINERGQIVGISWRRAKGGYQEETHAFLWENGTMRPLGTLGGHSSEPAEDEELRIPAVAINERGQVVGRSNRNPNLSQGQEPDWHAFLWQKGRMRDLGTLAGGRSSMAVGINDRGQIVGDSDTRNSSSHAFLWDAGRMLDLGAGGGEASYATAINAKGQIIGYSLKFPAHSDPDRREFVWQNGRLTALGTFSNALNENIALNNHNQIVGGREGTRDSEHAVLWTWKPAT